MAPIVTSRLFSAELVGFFFLLVERARELAQYLEMHVLSIIIISLFLLESLPIASLSSGGWISLSSPSLLMTLVNLQIQCFILRKLICKMDIVFLTDIDYCHFQGCWFSISTEAFLILNMIWYLKFLFCCQFCARHFR